MNVGRHNNDMRQHSRRELWCVVLLTALFVGGNLFALFKDNYIISVVPLLVLCVVLCVVRLEYMFLGMALLTPFAVNVSLFPQMQLSLPVEPMMILFSAVFLFRIALTGAYDFRILRHPVSVMLLLSLLWMLVTSVLSRIPEVSFKYLVSRLWFVIPFFFAAVALFRYTKNIKKFYWYYVVGLVVIILIATTKTASSFTDLKTLQTLHHVMSPFYNDHTAYGCAIALMLPMAFYMLFDAQERRQKAWLKWCAAFLLLVGLYLSFCRAAWLSVVAAAGMYVLIRMGMKLKWMALIAALAVGMFFAYQGDILYKLGKNHQDSSYEVGDQIKSMTNIATDASNLERLNRWASAFRMWADHPVNGTGPGTYQFVYAGYQRSYQLSVISTNAGDNGNAHSEYIGPLCEQGVVGVALVVILFSVTFVTGIRVYRTARNPHVANMALALALSLLTYYVHGFFNNFLDTDKLSVPFWAMTAAIVALDLYATKEEPEEQKKQLNDGV